MAFPDTTGSTVGRQHATVRSYLDTLKSRWWLILLTTAITVGAAIAYVSTAEKVYSATADVLVTPVPDDSQAYVGLSLIRRASDPTRDVTTASRLIANNDVAVRVADRLRLESSTGLLDRVTVEPVAQSSIVAITAESASPREAQRLANAFGSAAVAERTEQLHAQLDGMIATLRQRTAKLPEPAEGAAPNDDPLRTQLTTLETLRSGPDPTLELETPAGLPTDPVSPKPRLSIVGGVLAGLLLGVVGAFALKLLDVRMPREELLSRLGLPTLVRVPRRGRSLKSRQAFNEAFRSLHTTIRFAPVDKRVRTIAVTSASPGEGKTTTAFQLAMAAVEAGQRVLLVEADPYRPALSDMIDPPEGWDGHGDAPGLLDYLAGHATLDQVVRPTGVPGLSFLPAGPPRNASITGLLERARGRWFVDLTVSAADLLILDCPPVGPRADAVIFASFTDGILFVVDLHDSSERAIEDAVRRLRGAEGRVLGAVINRDAEASIGAYYYGGRETSLGANGSSRAGARRPLEEAAEPRER